MNHPMEVSSINYDRKYRSCRAMEEQLGIETMQPSSITNHNNRLPQTNYSFTLVNCKSDYGPLNNPCRQHCAPGLCLGYRDLMANLKQDSETAFLYKVTSLRENILAPVPSKIAGGGVA